VSDSAHGRAAAWLLLGALCVAISGCASGQAATGASASEPVTELGAVQFANAVNLSAHDLPEMTMPFAAGEAPPPGASAVAFARCFGGVNPTLRKLKAHSPEFTSGRAANARSLQSEVEVLPSAALAASSLAAYSSPRGLACISKAENTLHRRRRGTLRLGPVTITRLAVPLPRAARSFGLRITATLHGAKRHIPVYKDVFGFLVGPAEIELTAVGFTHPIPAATENRLLAVLYQRATDHQNDL
jgi:hypothetical protein